MTVFDSHKIEQIAAYSAYSGGTPVRGLILVKGLQTESYLLVTTPTSFTEQAEEREARDVNGTDLMPARVIESMQTGNRNSVKVLSGKQTNALQDKPGPFMHEDMGTVMPPSAVILREIKRKGIESLAARGGGYPVTR